MERACVPVSQSGLMQLVGHAIQAADLDAEGTLTLTFSNGQRLVCVKDTMMYEAYHVAMGEEEFVV